MQRRTVLKGMAVGAAGAWTRAGVADAVHAFAGKPQRPLQICVVGDAPTPITETAKAIQLRSGHALLRALSDEGPPVFSDSRSLVDDNFKQILYSHLILVGLPDDPLIQAAWQREAKPEDGGMYIFGYGHLYGDIGYVESDRSPFLHSPNVQSAPFETQVITITGSTPVGVKLAADAFLDRSLVNGVIAASGWSRPTVSLLDRDPLPPGFALPDVAEERMGDMHRIGWTQATEDEYRGVLADCGVMPEAIWRAKYYKRGNWDSAGAFGAYDNYVAGLHRRSYGNSLWLAQFSSGSVAATGAPKIAAAAHLRSAGHEQWSGDQIPYAGPGYVAASDVPGTLTLTRSGEWLLMSAVQVRTS